MFIVVEVTPEETPAQQDSGDPAGSRADEWIDDQPAGWTKTADGVLSKSQAESGWVASGFEVRIVLAVSDETIIPQRPPVFFTVRDPHVSLHPSMRATP